MKSTGSNSALCKICVLAAGLGISASVWAEDPYVDPVGSYTINNRMCMGASWSTVPGAYGLWQDLRFGAGTAWHNWNAPLKFSGGRVVCPATANGQWGVHPVK